MSAGCVVVTGAGSGIGRGIVSYLRERGNTVVGVDIVWPGGSEVDSEPRCEIDVTDEDDVVTGISSIERQWGRIRGLVTCAGIIRLSDPLSLSGEEFRKVMDVNVTGTFLVARECARQMATGEGGSIVTIASVSGMLAAPQRSAYSSSKGAVMALTRALAFDLADRGIRVNAVAPGSTRTPLLESVQTPALRTAVLNCVPMNRLGEPDEVAAVVEFLLSERSSFVTGQVWAADGGQSIQAGWRLPGEAHHRRHNAEGAEQSGAEERKGEAHAVL